MKTILSAHNDTVKYWKQLAQKPLQENDRSVLFFAEGEHMCMEAISSGKAVTLIIQQDRLDRFSALSAQFHSDDLYIVSPEVMKQICDTRTPQGIACVCRISAENTDNASKIVALEGVQDPGNVGTILRTMDAAGFDQLIINRNCANPFGPKASRASMGAIFRIGITFTDDLPEFLKTLDKKGFSILAGELQGHDLFATDYDPKNVCILIGNEGTGLTDDAMAVSNTHIRIPMPGNAESLNAGVACAIMIYDVLRRESVH